MYFCAVPVFPATTCSASAAACPVPRATTALRISLRIAAVRSEITRTGAARGGCAMTLPPASTTWSMMCGATRTPPFATVAIAVSNCSGVTPTSCPNEIDAFETADHLSVRRSMPGVSPGSSIPVRSPNPNLRM